VDYRTAISAMASAAMIASRTGKARAGVMITPYHPAYASSRASNSRPVDLAAAMSSPANAAACRAAGACSRSTAVPLCEVTQPLSVVSVSSANTNVRLIHPLLCFCIVP